MSLSERNARFLWVKLQLDAVVECRNRMSVRKVLKSLPRSLDDTYARILLYLPPSRVLGTSKALQWLCFCIRPVTLSELVEVVAADKSDTHQELEDILLSCSLLKKDPDGIMRFIHFSVRQYLVSGQVQDRRVAQYFVRETSANAFMARTCLAYILDVLRKTSIAKQAFLHPLLQYAIEAWPTHYRKVVGHSEQTRLDNLVQDISHEELEDKSGYQWLVSSIEEPSTPLIYRMALLGITGIVAKMLRDDAARPDCPPAGTYGYALGAACHAGHEDVVQLLLDYGADINPTFPGDLDAKIETPLSLAVREGSGEMVQMLLDRGAHVELGGSRNATPLFIAVERQNEHIVRALLERGADSMCRKDDGVTPLHIAASQDSDDILLLLLQSGAHIDISDRKFETPLHYAAARGRDVNVYQILSAGADMNAVNSEGQTALDKALEPVEGTANQDLASARAAHEEGRKRVVGLLVSRGFDVDALYGHKGTRLQAAVRSGNEWAVGVLLEAGADPSLYREGKPFPHYDPGSPLHEAVCIGYAKLVEMLLAAGADVNFRCPSGTPLQWAASAGDVTIVLMLLDAGADVNAIRATNDPALTLALGKNHEKIVRLLLEHGADPNITTLQRSNLKIAASKSKEMEQILLNYGATDKVSPWESWEQKEVEWAQSIEKRRSVLTKAASAGKPFVCFYSGCGSSFAIKSDLDLHHQSHWPDLAKDLD